MSVEFQAYIVHYGYLAIFALVFLQEVGIPNPVPNEFILLFSGYLSSVGVISFPLVILTAVAADFIGTSLLFFVFHFFGKKILDNRPKWFPISHEKIEKLKDLLSKRDWWGIYVGRLIPYVRGYTSIAAGLLQMSPGVFLPVVLFSALTWSGGYVILGNVLGPEWNKFTDRFTAIGNPFYILLGAIAAYFLASYIIKDMRRRKKAKQG